MSESVRLAVRSLAPEWLLTLWRRCYWWQARRTSPRRTKAVVRRLLRSDTPIRLELGSGPRLQGWTSLDLNLGAHIQHDLTDPLPFPSESIDEIYSSHVLEHFSYPQPLLQVVRECHRVLKPGGRIRVAVPDASIYLRAYFEFEQFDVSRFCDWDVGLKFRNRMDVVNFIAHLGGDHRHLFDAENLLDLLNEGGFRNASPRAFDPGIDLPLRRHESIYAEADK